MNRKYKDLGFGLFVEGGEGGEGGGAGGGSGSGSSSSPTGGSGSGSGGAQTYDEAYVSRLRSESAASRNEAAAAKQEAASAKAEVEKLKGSMSAREQADAATQQKLDELSGRLNETLEEAKNREKTANKRVISSELRRMASENGLTDPDLLSLFDRKGLEVDDDGHVFVKDGDKQVPLDDKFKAWMEAKPNFFDKSKRQTGSKATPPASGQGSGGNDTPPSTDFMKAPSAEVEAAWNSFGSAQKRVFK